VLAKEPCKELGSRFQSRSTSPTAATQRCLGLFVVEIE